MSSRREFLKVASLGAAAVLMPRISQAKKAADKPNIIFIMSDDHTSQAIGAYGSRLAKLNPTPVIDTLAKGQPLDVPARRMAFDRTRLSMPLTDDYRLLLVQEAKRLRPVAVVGHERYDAMAKNAAIKGW